MRSLGRLAAVSAAVVLLGAAFATEGSAASYLSCYRAFKSACGEVKPSSLKACFASHSNKLSRSCGDKLPHAVAIARECEADARKFCSHVARAASVPACMNRRLAEVGEPCRDALAKVGIAVPRKRRSG